MPPGCRGMSGLARRTVIRGRAGRTVPGPPQGRVSAVRADQFPVRAGLADLAVLQHDDPVGVMPHVQTVSDLAAGPEGPQKFRGEDEVR